MSNGKKYAGIGIDGTLHEQAQNLCIVIQQCHTSHPPIFENPANHQGCGGFAQFFTDNNTTPIIALPCFVLGVAIFSFGIRNLEKYHGFHLSHRNCSVLRMNIWKSSLKLLKHFQKWKFRICIFQVRSKDTVTMGCQVTFYF